MPYIDVSAKLPQDGFHWQASDDFEEFFGELPIAFAWNTCAAFTKWANSMLELEPLHFATYRFGDGHHWLSSASLKEASTSSTSDIKCHGRLSGPPPLFESGPKTLTLYAKKLATRDKEHKTHTLLAKSSDVHHRRHAKAEKGDVKNNYDRIKQRVTVKTPSYGPTPPFQKLFARASRRSRTSHLSSSRIPSQPIYLAN
jgi:hypothetical protein